MKLSEIKVGESVRVKKIKGDINIRQRLLSMGILPGEIIKVEKIAPLGDPIDISVKNYHLSLRKEESDLIIVERI